MNRTKVGRAERGNNQLRGVDGNKHQYGRARAAEDIREKDPEARKAEESSECDDRVARKTKRADRRRGAEQNLTVARVGNLAVPEGIRLAMNNQNAGDTSNGSNSRSIAYSNSYTRSEGEGNEGGVKRRVVISATSSQGMGEGIDEAMTLKKRSPNNADAETKQEKKQAEEEEVKKAAEKEERKQREQKERNGERTGMPTREKNKRGGRTKSKSVHRNQSWN